MWTLSHILTCRTGGIVTNVCKCWIILLIFANKVQPWGLVGPISIWNASLRSPTYIWSHLSRLQCLRTYLPIHLSNTWIHCLMNVCYVMRDIIGKWSRNSEDYNKCIKSCLKCSFRANLGNPPRLDFGGLIWGIVTNVCKFQWFWTVHVQMINNIKKWTSN